MLDIKLETTEKQEKAFVLYDEGIKQGFMTYSQFGNDLTAYHVEVVTEGKGYAKAIMDAMVAYARQYELCVIPLCPYVLVQFKRHPQEYADIWKKADEDENE